MKPAITSRDLRVDGELLNFIFGLTLVVIFLIFLSSISIGIAAVLLLIYTILTLWIMQNQYLGSSIRISASQFPHLDSLLKEAANRLYVNTPVTFIRQSVILNAFALGFLREKCILVHSALVETFTNTELQFILGHELTHIKCGHTTLLVLTSTSRGIGVPLVSQLLHLIFLSWSRKAEYTCDRGGLVACRDLKAAIGAMCKLAIGPKLYSQLNTEEFLKQNEELDKNDFAKIAEGLSTHPYLLKRIKALEEFYETDEYKRLCSFHE